jgi:hypothetical protein
LCLREFPGLELHEEGAGLHTGSIVCKKRTILNLNRMLSYIQAAYEPVESRGIIEIRNGSVEENGEIGECG